MKSMLLVLTVATALASAGCTDPNAPAPASADFVAQSCHKWVKERLASPTSAHFDNDNVQGQGSGDWVMTGTVDAQNYYGAQIRSSYTCRTHDDATQLHLVSIDGLQ